VTLRVELEWGQQGLRALSQSCEAVVIIDVLSFSTSVTMAVARGAAVWPHAGEDRAEELARAIGATLARGRNSREGRTLSPASMLDVVPGERIVMPSPNGSALSHAALVSGLAVIAGAMRNAAAVATWLTEHVSSVGLVPAGEQWADTVCGWRTRTSWGRERSPRHSWRASRQHSCPPMRQRLQLPSRNVDRSRRRRRVVSWSGGVSLPTWLWPRSWTPTRWFR